MSSFSGARKILAPALLALLVSAFSHRHERAVRAPLRSSVTLLLEIQGDYRDLLDDDACVRRCDTLLKSLDADVRTALDARYPFIDWFDRTGAADTVVMRWQNSKNVGFPGSAIEFELRGPHRSGDSTRVHVDFEYDTVITNRRQWNAAAVRAAWLKTLPGSLQGNELLSRVFGRIPLNAPVAFQVEPQITIPAKPKMIRAARPPVFELSVKVVSNRFSVSDTGAVLLSQCSEWHQGQDTVYSCPMSEIALPNRKFAAELQTLLQDRSVTWRETRIRGFTPTGVAITSGMPQ